MTAKVIRMDEFRERCRATTFEDVYLSWVLAAMSLTFFGIMWMRVSYANRQISTRN